MVTLLIFNYKPYLYTVCFVYGDTADIQTVWWSYIGADTSDI